jgi:hypothetical protein
MEMFERKHSWLVEKEHVDEASLKMLQIKHPDLIEEKHPDEVYMEMLWRKHQEHVEEEHAAIARVCRSLNSAPTRS